MCVIRPLAYIDSGDTRSWVSKFNKPCAWRHSMPPPPCKLTISSYLFARWHLFRHVGYLRYQQQVDVWPLTLKVVSEARVTWATSVPILVFLWPLSSRVRPDVRDRQTDVRQKHRLMPPPYGGGGGIISSVMCKILWKSILKIQNKIVFLKYFSK